MVNLIIYLPSQYMHIARQYDSTVVNYNRRVLYKIDLIRSSKLHRTPDTKFWT